MGCWSETCQISGMPITDGTPMVTIILEQNPYAEHEGGNVTYPVDLWHVKSFAIRGVYGDYGVPEDMVENELTNELLHRYKVSDLDSFITDIERGEVEKMAVYYILEDVYDEIISMYGLTVKHQEDYYHQGNLLTRQKEQLDKFIRNLHYYDTDHVLAVVNDQEFSFQYRIKDEKEFAEINRTFEDIKSMLPNFLKRMYRSSESMTVPCCNFYDGEGYYATLSEEQKYFFLKLTFEGMFEIYMLQRFMVMTRNAFGPRAGKGSQSNNFEMYMEMYDFFKKIAEKGEKKFEE